MATGTVKWFSDAKGYGFIEPDGEAGKDIFAHFSAIQMDGFRTLRMGSRVSYELHDGPKGLHAQQIAPLNGTDNPWAASEPTDSAPSTVLDPVDSPAPIRESGDQAPDTLQF